jgi:hypothetical protein
VTDIERNWDLPAGLVARPVRYSDDGATPQTHPDDERAILQIVRACESVALGAVESTSAEVTEMLLGPVIDRDASALVLDGEAVVGFVLVERDPTAADTWFDL